MSLIIQCACGQKLRTSPENAGKRIRCPKCKAIVTTPPPGEASAKGPGFEVVEDENEAQDIPAAAAAEEEEFEVLESERDLPTVERAKKKPKRDPSLDYRPKRRTIDDDLYDTHDSDNMWYYLRIIGTVSLAIVVAFIVCNVCCGLAVVLTRH
jgi:hypothetical protein